MINLHQAIHYIRHFISAKRNGHGVHSPLAYELCEEVFYNLHAYYDFDTLKNVRNTLLKNNESIEVTDYGAGSKTFSSSGRKIRQIADKGISTTLQSEIFYKLINFFKFNTAIELGTSIGLNTLYLAKANTSSKVISIEGSKNLSDFSAKLAKDNGVVNIEFINAKFDEVLPAILSRVGHPLLLYIDGNHTYEATLHYFNLALQKQTGDTVIIFDDIYWSKGMTKAWNEIRGHSSVTLSIDTFYFGIIFFKPELKEKVDLKFFLKHRPL